MFSKMWVFNIGIGFFIIFLLILMDFWPYLGGYWPKLSSTRDGLLGLDPLPHGYINQAIVEF
jgi:hypothetical protein